MAYSNVICDRCGTKYKSNELRQEARTGYMVCRLCLDPRDPAINRAPIERPQIPWVSAPNDIELGLNRTIHLPSNTVTLQGSENSLNPGMEYSLGASTVSVTPTSATGFHNLVCAPIFACNFDSDSTADISPTPETFDGVGDAEVADSRLILPTNGTNRISWSGGDLNSYSTEPIWTIEWYMKMNIGGSGYADREILRFTGFNVDSRVFAVSNSGSGSYRKLYFRNGILLEARTSSTTWTQNEWKHFALVHNNTDDTLQMWFHGARVINDSSNIQSPLPNADAILAWGIQGSVGDGDIEIDDIRMSPCEVYSGESFTPPARGSLPATYAMIS